MKNTFKIFGIAIVMAIITINVYAQEQDNGKDFVINGGTIEQHRGSNREVRIPTVTYPITAIGNNAFKDKTDIETVIIPNSIVSIGDRAFQGCTGLTSVIIPSSVIRIGENAFSGCTKLTSVTFQGAISSANFHVNSPFDGDLRAKYILGGPGTYLRQNQIWTKEGTGAKGRQAQPLR